MCMHHLLYRTPPWFYEGAAEYFAACHKGNGWFTFHDAETSVKDYLRSKLAPGKDGRFVVTPVADALAFDHQAWIKATSRAFPGEQVRPYATSLLLAHYHFHGGNPRREKVAAYLRKIHALAPRQSPPPFPAEDARDIEARLIKFWGPKGINLVFAKP